MNIKNLGLIVFAIVALAAVFSFILVIGRPQSSGAVAASQLYGINPVYKDAYVACATLSPCPNRVPGVPIGVANRFHPGVIEPLDKYKVGIDAFRGDLYVCKCLGAQPGGFPGGYYGQVYLRSPYKG